MLCDKMRLGQPNLPNPLLILHKTNVRPSKKFHEFRNRLCVTAWGPRGVAASARGGGEDDLMNKRLPSRRRTRDSEERPNTCPPKLGPEVKAKIGQHLRVMYAEIVDQGVPNRFVEILRRLDDHDDPVEDEGSKVDDEGSKNGPS
jgi:hypothetical protein